MYNYIIPLQTYVRKDKNRSIHPITKVTGVLELIVNCLQCVVIYLIIFYRTVKKYALVVQRIAREIPVLKMWVRFLPRAPYYLCLSICGNIYNIRLNDKNPAFLSLQKGALFYCKKIPKFYINGCKNVVI